MNYFLKYLLGIGMCGTVNARALGDDFQSWAVWYPLS